MATIPPLDLERVRSYFPSLSGEWVFMDNAGGSQTLRPVVDRIREYLLTTNVQLGASYDVSVRAGERVEEAVRSVAEWIGAQEPSEVVLGSSTSMLLRNLASSLGRTWKPG